MDMHVVVRHEDWAIEATGEALYAHTFRILRWGGDSFGSKINSRKKVEAELGISHGDQEKSGVPYQSYCGGWR